ncbi:MAG: hypothetical protein ACI80L_002421, partial [Pseudohongiellaceae bacterium]
MGTDLFYRADSKDKKFDSINLKINLSPFCPLV